MGGQVPLPTRRSNREIVRRARLRGLLWDKVPRDHRQDPRPFLVRRVVTGGLRGGRRRGAGLVAADRPRRLDVLRRHPGPRRDLDGRGVRVGAAVPRPDRQPRDQEHLRRPVSGRSCSGCCSPACSSSARWSCGQVPLIDRQVSSVLDHADQGVTPLLLLITVVNGVAEELFFRGALYAAVPRHPVVGEHGRLRRRDAGHRQLHAGVRGDPARSRRRPRAARVRRVLAPVLTHVTWSTVMLFALPLLF